MKHSSSTLKLIKRISLVLIVAAAAGIVSVLILPLPAWAGSPIFVRPGGDDLFCNGTANVDHNSAVAPACAVKTVQRAMALAGPGSDVVLDTGTDLITIPAANGISTAAATLVVDKTDSPDPVAIQTLLTYTVRISNTGDSPAFNVQLVDVLPQVGVVSFKSATSSQGSGCSPLAPNVISCTLGTIVTNTNAVVTIVVTPTAAGNIFNSASASDSAGAGGADDELTRVEGVTDLSISKTDFPDPVLEGQPLTYTLTITNSGPSAAAVVTLTDYLPGGVLFGSVTPSQGTCVNGSPVTCNLGLMGNNATATVRLVVTPTTFGVITNTVNVAGGDIDPNLFNNVATQTTTVVARANLSVSKSDDPDPVQAGSTLTYTIVVANAGPSTATNVTLNDTLPGVVTINNASGNMLVMHLDEVTGATSFSDVSGNNYSGTCSGPTCPTAGVGGRFGSALRFDGVDDFVSLGNPAGLNLGGNITLQAWVNSSVTSGLQDIVAHGYTTSPDAALFLRINNGSYEVGSWNGANHLAAFAIPSGDVGNWIHLAGVYDGIAWRLYRNGTEVSSTPDATGAVTVTGNWAIGARGTGSERFFTGLIDEVAIFNRALTPGEIAALNQRALSGKVSTTQGRCSAAGSTATCDLGHLPSLGTATVRLNVTVASTATGVMINTASVTTTAFDSDPANNVDTETTTIIPQGSISSTIYLPIILKSTPPSTATPTPKPPTPTPTPLAHVSDVKADVGTNQVFVASPRHDWVYVINGGTDTLTRNVPVGHGPTGLTVLKGSSPANNKVFAAHQYGANFWRPGFMAFGVNDTSAHNTFDNGYAGAAPVKTAANSTNNRVYVSNYFDKLAVYEGGSETRLNWVVQKAFQGAYGIDTSSATNRVYLATRDTGELVVFDGNGDRLLQSNYIPTHVKPPHACSLWSVVVNEATGHVFVPCPQLGRVFVLQEGQITVLDLETLGVLEERDGNMALVVSPQAAPWLDDNGISVPIGTGEEGIAVVNSSTGYVFITNAQANIVVVLQDGPSPAYVATVGVGTRPQGVDVNSVMQKVYVGNTGSNSVTVLNANSPFNVIKTIPLAP